MPLSSTLTARCRGRPGASASPSSATPIFSSSTPAMLHSCLNCALRVVDVGDAARHAGGEVAPGLAQHHDHAAGHVFAAMVAAAFDHRDGAGVAHREALAGDALEIRLAGDRAVQHGVADDDVLAPDRASRLGGWRTTTRPPDRPLPT